MMGQKQTGLPWQESESTRGERLPQYYVLIALFIFATALKPFLGEDNRNLLLIGFMTLSPLFVFSRRIPAHHVILYLFLASILLFPLIVNPGHVRWSTILFTVMFALSFIAYENVLRSSKLSIDRFVGAVRILLLAYFSIFVVQQFGVLTGLPIINESNYSEVSRWKLNSLSAEASHAARYVNVLMFAYLSLREVQIDGRYRLKQQLWEDRHIWGGYAWISLTMQSTTALIFVPIILLKVLDRRNFVFVMLFGGLLLLALNITSEQQSGRALAIIQAAASFDYRMLLAADHSGSLRVAPLFVLAEKIELFSVQGMFGHGVDTVSLFMSQYIYGVKQGYTGGGMLRVWYEYGFLSFALFTIFSMQAASATRSVSNFLLWLLIVFLTGPNNQVVWLYLITSVSIRHFKKNVSSPQLN